MDKQLIQAYRNACYRVFGAPEFVLQVDRQSSELMAWQRAHRVGSSAFLTAFNPGSRLLPAEHNRANHASLIEALDGLVHVAARGEDPDGEWPDEEGVLVAGIEREQARQLARRFGQKAFLHAADDAVPRLIWTDKPVSI